MSKKNGLPDALVTGRIGVKGQIDTAKTKHTSDWNALADFLTKDVTHHV